MALDTRAGQLLSNEGLRPELPIWTWLAHHMLVPDFDTTNLPRSDAARSPGSETGFFARLMRPLAAAESISKTASDLFPRTPDFAPLLEHCSPAPQRLYRRRAPRGRTQETGFAAHGNCPHSVVAEEDQRWEG